MWGLLVRWGMVLGFLWLFTRFMPGFHVLNWRSAVGLAAALVVTHVLIRPILIWLTAPLYVRSLGVISLFFQMGLILLALQFFPGVQAGSGWMAVGYAALMTLLVLLGEQVLTADP